MKIEINSKNYDKIQKEIYDAQSRRTDKKIRADFVLDFKEDVKKLIRKCGRKISDYNGAKVNFEPRFRFKNERKFKGTSFDIEIIKGKFYLIDVYVTRCHSRLQEGIIKVEKIKEEEDYFSEGYRGNYIEVVGDVLTFRLKNEGIIFDYKWDSYHDFDRVMSKCCRNLPECSILNIKRKARGYFVDKFPNKVRKQKLNKYLNEITVAA